MPNSMKTRRTFVLDTSVLLSDPRALNGFPGGDVVIPIVVISELEGKRHDPELGFFARAALRALDDLGTKYGTIADCVPAAVDGTLRVELNHIDLSFLPAGMRGADNDSRILAVAKNLSLQQSLEDGPLDVTVVSKDVPMRLKAAALGLRADDYAGDGTVDSGWSGVERHDVADSVVAALYNREELDWDSSDTMPVNTSLVLRGTRSQCLARVHGDGVVRLVNGDREVFGLHGRSAEQRLAIDLLTDPSVGIVSMGGNAGTGKSALALCAGLEAVMERQEHKKVIIFRPLYAVGGQELGFLPGGEEEKMGPWAQAVFDVLGSVASEALVHEIVERKLVEVLPLTHIRGRSLHDAYVIVDEAQSLEKNVLLTVLSRIGQGSKVVLTHDVAQRDNLRVGRHDGVAAVVEALKGNALFGHVTLVRSERSKIAELVTDLLGGLV